MTHSFEIEIMLRVSSSQDVTAQHLEGHLRQPDIQNRNRDVVERLLPPLETKKRDVVEYHAEVILVTAEAT